MVPRSRKAPPSRVPILLSTGAVLLGAVGLVLDQLVS